VILRTSWVYATFGSNFIKTILRLAQERDQLRIVSDQIGAPTGAELIADVTAHIVRSLQSKVNETPVSGLYHLAARGHTSWYGFAHYILTQAARADVLLKTSTGSLYPIPSTEYPTPAVRPLNSRLDTTKLQKTFNLYLPDWQDGVFRTLSEILVNQQSRIR
jgi:dTDP-4-dehydrorhamnose reductase